MHRSGIRYPLSLVQRGLLADRSGVPGTSVQALVRSRAFRLRGPLDLDRLSNAVATVVRRHGALRCMFDLPAGAAATQTLRHRMPVMISRIVASESEVATRLGALSSVPMDIATGPLLDVSILAIEPETHILLLRCHRAVADDPAFDVVVREIGYLYNRTRTPLSSALPEPATHYPELVQAHAESVDEAAAALSYWKSELGERVSTRSDGARRASPSSAPLILFPDTVRSLRALAESHHLDSAEVLRAAFAMVLAADPLTDGPIAIASTRAQRPLPELDSIIGPFTYSQPWILDLDGLNSFPALLDRVRVRKRVSRPYARIPLEYLCHELGLPSIAWENRFALRSGSTERLRLHGLTATAVDLPSPSETATRTLEFTERAGSLRGRIDSRFEDAASLADRLEKLLEAVAAEPKQALATR